MASNVRVTELDFDQIKNNLKTFLRAQPEFTDYDFEASNLSVLIDLLAYNTHYNAVLANMVSNEMFLDTALKRSSVASIAKQIGYTPRSIQSARAIVDITLQNVPNSPNYVTLDRYTPFSTNIDGTPYTFYTIKTETTTPVGGVYTFKNVELYQGRKLDYYFTVTDATPAAKYVIPNLNVDTTTLEISIQYGGTGSYLDTFSQNTDITNLSSESKVYFLQENTQGYYEFHFGDGVLGVAPSVGDVIRVSYLISDGANANVSNNLAVSWSTNTIAGESSIDRAISTTSKPSGGYDGDTIEDIRFRSINNYSAQNRAVTETDYINVISANLPGAESVNVWGGEKNEPPVYGKTFISIKPKTGYVLTDVEKQRIINDVLKPRSMVTVEHSFVDPNYTYVNLHISVRYNSTRTTLTTNQINSLTYSKAVDFMSTNLGKFNTNFYHSQLEEQIMNIDDSIISANVHYSIVKKIPLVPNVRFTTTDVIQLPIKIHPNELRSSYFYFTDDNGIHPSQIRDVPDENPPDYEGTGVIKTFDLNTGEVLNDNLGTVNYGTGKITLRAESRLTLSGYLGSASMLYVYAGVQENVGDIFPAFNEILVADTATADPIANIANGITIDVISATN